MREFGMFSKGLSVRSSVFRTFQTLALAGLCVGLGSAPALGGDRATLRGFTFMVTESVDDFFRVSARRAELETSSGVAQLSDVTVNLVRPALEVPLDVRSDRATVSLRGDAFKMEGAVEGWDRRGRRFETAWLEYDPRREVLFTSAPVVLFDAESVIRANGLEYETQTRTLRLTGGTQVRSRPR